MKRTLWLLSAVLLALLGGTAMSTGSAETYVSLFSASFGTRSYVLGAALADISNESGSSVRIDAAESPWFIFNIKKLAFLRAAKLLGASTAEPGTLTKGLTLLIGPVRGCHQWLPVLGRHQFGPCDGKRWRRREAGELGSWRESGAFSALERMALTACAAPVFP